MLDEMTPLNLSPLTRESSFSQQIVIDSQLYARHHFWCQRYRSTGECLALVEFCFILFGRETVNKTHEYYRVCYREKSAIETIMR